LKGLIFGLFIWFITKVRVEAFDLAYGRFNQAAGSIFYGFFMWISFGLLLGILYDGLLNGEQYHIREKRIKTYDMKSGIIPGAIAGIAGGVASSILSIIGHVTGYFGIITAGEVVSTIEFWWSQAGTHILITMIWGTIFATFFAKVYNLVPGEKVKKGLYYGLIMYAITTFLIGTYVVSWSLYHNNWRLASFYFGSCFIIASSMFIVFGLVLGLLYRKPTK